MLNKCLGVKNNETKILGITWDKLKDKFSVDICKDSVEITKRGILSFLAGIFESLGLFSALLR